MIACFHLVSFRRRKLLPPGRSPGRVEGLRFWRALWTAKDPFLAIPPNVSNLRLLMPNPREWAFFAVWESEHDAERFLARSPIAEGWRSDAAETWSVWLKPVRARGDWSGVQALDGPSVNGLPSAPAAALTHLDLSVGVLGAMWFSAVPGIVGHMPSVPGLLVGIPLMDRPYLNPMTFSVWRSADDALAFAYRQTPHQQAISRLRRSDREIVSRFSSARFYPYRSEGSWKSANALP